MRLIAIVVFHGLLVASVCASAFATMSNPAQDAGIVAHACVKPT